MLHVQDVQHAMNRIKNPSPKGAAQVDGWLYLRNPFGAELFLLVLRVLLRKAHGALAGTGCAHDRLHIRGET